MNLNNGKMIIESYREDGSKFRPSDWVERICALNAIYGADHRLHYTSALKPMVAYGDKCLLVDRSLKEANPGLFDYIMGFAKENTLRIREYEDGYEEDVA